MRRIWAYIVLLVTSLFLVCFSYKTVVTNLSSNIEYQSGKELVFRISDKEDTKTIVNPLEPTPDGKLPIDIIASQMETRLAKSNVSLYQIKKLSNDTIAVDLSQQSNDDYNNISAYLSFNGCFALSNGQGDVALADEFLTNEEAFVTAINGYPTVVLPVDTNNASYKAVLEGSRSEDDEYGEKQSSGEGEEAQETVSHYLYLWYDYKEGYEKTPTDEKVKDKILMKFLMNPVDEDFYYKDGKNNKLFSSLNITENTIAAKANAYDTARYYVNLINADELDYKVTYMYSQNIPAWTEPLLTLGDNYGVAFNKTFAASLISFVIITLLLLVFYKIAAPAISIITLVAVFAGMASITWVSAEFTTFGIIGLILVAASSLASGILYMHKFKNECYRGRSMKKSNTEAAKKSFWPTVDIHLVLVITGAFLYLLGGPTMRVFGAVCFIGGLASALLNLIGLRGLMWLLTNATASQNKYTWFNMEKEHIPDLMNEEGQKYFGPYADKNLTVNKKKVGIPSLLVFVGALACIITFGAMNNGFIFANTKASYNSEMFFETITENSLVMKEGTIRNDILSNLYVYENDESSAKKMSTYIDSMEMFTYGEEINEENVSRYVYNVLLNDKITEDYKAFYDDGEGHSYRPVEAEDKLINNVLETLFTSVSPLNTMDGKIRVSLKSSSQYNLIQPAANGILTGTAIAIAVMSLYLMFRYRLSRGLAALATGEIAAIVTGGLFAMIHINMSNFIIGAVPAVAALALIMFIMFASTESGMLKESKNRNSMTLADRNETMIKATSSSYVAILNLAVMIGFIVVCFFGFGPKNTSSTYFLFAIGIIFATAFTVIVSGPIAHWIYRKLGSVKTPKLSHKKKKKAIASTHKSAEPEEAVFIGIND